MADIGSERQNDLSQASQDILQQEEILPTTHTCAQHNRPNCNEVDGSHSRERTPSHRR